jgi:hypothetical protein
VKLSLYAEDANTDSDRPFYVCESPPCRLLLWPGTYKVYAGGSDDTLSGARTLELSSSTRIVVDPDTKAHRTAGLTLGIAGPVLIFTGFVFLVSSIAIDSSQTSAQEDRATAGAFMLLGGVAITPIGWVMFGTSFKPEVETESARSERTWRTARTRLPSPGLSAGFHF